MMTSAEKLKDELFAKSKNGYEILDAKEKRYIFEYCDGYKDFLGKAKTERLAVKKCIELAENKGFSLFDPNSQYRAGDRVYFVNRGKSAIFAVIGREDISEGVNIIGSHIDSPRLDLKPNPLYEDSEMAFFKTHYYGGIKKYQWLTVPLTLCGVVALKDGSTVDILIGDDENDPAFTITDLLPHLGKDQMEKKMSEAVTGEGLNILLGSIPYADNEISDKVKLNIMAYLNWQYGIKESDFFTAELMAVPAYKPRDVGFDRSFVGAYGQDDKAGAYTSLTSLFEYDGCSKTAICLLTDKEETGSDGVTGAKSEFFEYAMQQLAGMSGTDLRTVFINSACLSADLGNAYDPNYPEVSEKNNSCYINHGIGVMKYSGSRGKSSTSDADAEFIAKIIGIFEKNGILWQTGELGKVDQGGGGTIAMYMARRNIQTIDAGVALLSVHSPFEISAKLDVYMTYKAFCAFYKDMR